MDGLRLLPSSKGEVSWTVFSAPSEPYRKVFNFYYDTFVVVNPEKNLDGWNITLYNRDIRSEDSNFKETKYSFFEGKRI